MFISDCSFSTGESNVGQASYYSCAFPSMIKRWRELFQNPDAWFGFVQIAGWQYSRMKGGSSGPNTKFF